MISVRATGWAARSRPPGSTPGTAPGTAPGGTSSAPTYGGRPGSGARSGAVIAGPRAGSAPTSGDGEAVSEVALLSGVDGRGAGTLVRGDGGADDREGDGDDRGAIVGWVGGGDWVGDEAGVGSTEVSAGVGGPVRVDSGSGLSGDAIVNAYPGGAPYSGGAPYPGGAITSGASVTAAAASVAAHQAMARPAVDMVRSPRSPARAHVREGYIWQPDRLRQNGGQSRS